ncbi:MAG: type II toxin-antitoxin system VapB family antitoxin [Actinomycetota bacterium]|nr:type II toxin-antitoxin system VapB family antitoxin [Actinomycetota bacterium]
MGLNIKNERVCALARKAATATQQTQTSVIEQALQELLARHRVDAADAEEAKRVERARLTLVDMQQRWAATDSERPFTTDDLYDENGLPA